MDESHLDTLFGSSMPGADEVAALDLFGLYMDEWDRIVIDTAPTGHTLRLLDLLRTVGSAVQTAAGIRKNVKRTADRVETVVLGPFVFSGEDEADEAFQDLQARMERVTEVYRDPELTSFRVVLRPEPLVLSETERPVSRLRDAQVEVTGLVANGVLVDGNEDCDRCVRQRGRRRDRLDTVHETLDPPATMVPELDEPSGVEARKGVGASLVGK
jgi:arsenite-transporting ATPase